ncbi:hypothetical protein PO909_009145 [Leuciscus waleckii]
MSGKTASGIKRSSVRGFPKTCHGHKLKLSAVFEMDISCQGYGYEQAMNSFYRTVSFISTLTHEIIFDL